MTEDKSPELIVMLTQNDRTIKNAYEIFEQCKESKAKYWGFKEKGLSRRQMKELFSYMKKCGKTTVLEVVAYTEKECIDGALTAIDCGCDILMGTMYFESVHNLLKEHSIKYIPFIGKVSQRPSILEGTVEEIIAQGEEISQKGVFGFDLLGYRYTGDINKLISEFVLHTKLPVCVAGSVDSYERLDLIKKVSPWSFTIGGAFFEHCFGECIKDQIDKVFEYINRK